MRRLSPLVVLSLAVQPVLAHETGQPHTESSPVPPVVVLAGALVLGTTLFLDYRDMLSRRLALAGIFLGVLGVGVGIALLV
jgi:hypothetical protein